MLAADAHHVRGSLQNAAGQRQSCRVEHHAHRAVEHRADRTDRIVVRDVGHADPDGRLLGKRGQRLTVAPDDEHIEAGFNQPLDDRATDAARASHHDRRFIAR